MSVRAKKARSRRWEVIEVPAIDKLELLSEREMSKLALPEGFCVRFFCHDMRYLYTVASIYIKMTRGVLDYLHDYNQLGPNKSRNKLFLCSQYNREGRCLNGSYCREIHCLLPIDKAEDASKYGVPSNATGAPNVITLVDGKAIVERSLNNRLPFAIGASTEGEESAPGSAAAMDRHAPCSEGMQSVFDAIIASGVEKSTPRHALVPPLSILEASEMQTSSGHAVVISMPEDTILRHSMHSRWTSKAMYDTLPAGVQFCVALPNTPTPVDAYDSAELLVTRGAKEFYDQQVRHEPSSVTMQHCAHYSKNGICCFGEDCQFVHILHYRARERDAFENSCSDTEINPTTHTTGCDRRGNAAKQRRGTGSKETPLCIQVPGAPMGVGGGRSQRSRPSTNLDSRSSSTCNGSSIGTPAAASVLPNMGPSSCVYVPNAVPWGTAAQPPQARVGTAHQVMHGPPPPPPPGMPFSATSSMPKPMPFNTLGPPAIGPLQQQIHSQQSQQHQQPQPQPHQGQGQYVVMQGLNGEFFILPHLTQPPQPPTPSSSSAQPSVYMMPIPYS